MQEHETIFLILVLIACIFPAGCVHSSASSPIHQAVAETDNPAPDQVTPVSITATGTPVEVVTIIRYVSPVRVVKDSDLLFTLKVPAEWNVSTWRLANSDTPDYRTDLVADNVFSVTSYPASRSREQEYRDRFRQWVPAPVETMVTMNGIRYDRFESSAGGNTTVGYLARTNTANERGYAGVLVFVARNRFEREDFEEVVSSFRYFSLRSATTIPGDEILHFDVSGKAVSGKTGSGDPRVFDSSDWDTVGVSPDSPAGSTSGGGSTHSSGCHH